MPTQFAEGGGCSDIRTILKAAVLVHVTEVRPGV